jgi:hypothetical protein
MFETVEPLLGAVACLAGAGVSWVFLQQRDALRRQAEEEVRRRSTRRWRSREYSEQAVHRILLAGRVAGWTTLGLFSLLAVVLVIKAAESL